MQLKDYETVIKFIHTHQAVEWHHSPFSEFDCELLIHNKDTEIQDLELVKDKIAETLRICSCKVDQPKWSQLLVNQTLTFTDDRQDALCILVCQGELSLLVNEIRTITLFPGSLLVISNQSVERVLLVIDSEDTMQPLWLTCNVYKDPIY